MKKRSFVRWVIVGALACMAVLPAINYVNDQWRVLHRDVVNAYEGISVNKGYLKTVHLLAHPNRYDTLLFGSSRSAVFVESDIGKSVYNAYSDFAVVHLHLKTLQLLISHGYIPKNVWIGLNDFDIWKDPKDFDVDYSKRPYPDTLSEWVDFLKLYLFKPVNANDIAIWKGEKRLVPNDRIVRKEPRAIKDFLTGREKGIAANAAKWRKRLTSSSPTLLGYKDKEEQYRIDETVHDIERIVALAKRYDINVTFFMYPSFYKTYVYYNQTKIAEFKRKVASITEFYDFYRLDATAFDELKWGDTSHFLYSVGKALIGLMRQGKFKVTASTIEDDLKQVEDRHRLLLSKSLPIPYVMKIHPLLRMPGVRPIWDIRDAMGTGNAMLHMEERPQHVVLHVSGRDPNFQIQGVRPASVNVLFECRIESPVKTIFQLFFKPAKEDAFREKNSVKFRIRPGENRMKALIPSDFVVNGLRIDPAVHEGTYVVKDCRIYDLPER